jgi:hypothetical protein
MPLGTRSREAVVTPNEAATMIGPTARTTFPCKSTVLLWLALVEKYGSHTGALEALLRQADELDRLKAAVRSCGLKPELLLAGT